MTFHILLYQSERSAIFHCKGDHFPRKGLLLPPQHSVRLDVNQHISLWQLLRMEPIVHWFRMGYFRIPSRIYPIRIIKLSEGLGSDPMHGAYCLVNTHQAKRATDVIRTSQSRERAKSLEIGRWVIYLARPPLYWEAVRSRGNVYSSNSSAVEDCVHVVYLLSSIHYWPFYVDRNV